MIIVCQNCASRLQVDEAKVPAAGFTIRCPKCDSTIDSASPNPASEKSGLAVGKSPAIGGSRFKQPIPAPLFEAEGIGHKVNAPLSATERLAELLSSLIGQAATGGDSNIARASWNRRKALVCVPEDHRESIARGLIENGYQVFVAQDATQAVDRMREDRLDLVLLDAKFDPVEQGAVFVTREVNVMRPAQRRRLFFVLMSNSMRTMDSHAAFLNNANAVINLNEIEELPQLIDHRLREYNELYREFNGAIGMPTL
jgi:predicted Zn finger-like uncharacterized protein